MPLTRRNFLISGSLSLAAGAFSPLLVQAEKMKPSALVDFKDWESVRREFELAPDYVHLALFFLASHPRPVRQAIEQYRARIDANPFVAVESAIFEPTNGNIPLQVCRSIASYIGGDAQDIALTQNKNLSAGIVCFDVKGMKPEVVVKRLLEQRIVASTTPYRISYARVACSIVNTPQEVETVLRVIRSLG